MIENILTFRKYNSIEEAGSLLDTFKSNGIEYSIESIAPTVDLSFQGDTHLHEVNILIPADKFEDANQLLESLAKESIGKIDKDHYLLKFKDEELLEILERQDEWGPDDVVLAQVILSDRGNPIDKNDLIQFKESRLVKLRSPLKASRFWLNIAFVLVLLGGLAGVLIGWAVRYSKKTLYNGEQVYIYDAPSRNRAFNIMLAGIVLFIIWLIIILLSIYSQVLD